MVGGQDTVKALPLPHLLQKGIPQCPGGLLNGKPLPFRLGPDIAPAGEKGNSMGGAPVPDEPLVPVGVPPRS